MRAGAVSLNLRSSWSDRHGVHSSPIDETAVEAICIYCPETDECYYIRPADHGASVALRITPAKNGQQKRILDASAFRELPDKRTPPIGEHRASA